MSTEEWERVKQIFDAATASVTDEERPDFLKQACSDDPKLYPAVLDLLVNYTETPNAAPERPQGKSFQKGDIVAGRFHISRFVSSGGMGEVYEAFDESLRQRVALKTLRQDLLSEPDAVARFQREIRVARGVAHENLCKVFESSWSIVPQTVPSSPVSLWNSSTAKPWRNT